MRHWLILLVLLALVFASVSSVAAQQNPEVPLPGTTGTPADNLCNQGGAWADGRCNIPGHPGATALAWECGWYMARYYAGIYKAEQVPQECQHYFEKEETCVYTKPFGSGLRGPSISDPCCYYKPLGSNLRSGLTNPFGRGCCPYKPLGSALFGEPRRFAC